MNIFKSLQAPKVRYSTFDMSHEVKMSGKMGRLMPILLEEIVPGDRFKVRSEIMIRMAPLLAPVMHRINVYTHYFFVPNRIIFDDWKNFITGGRDGDLEINMPTMRIDESNKQYFLRGRLSDYFGIVPPDGQDTIVQPIEVCALPFRAYAEVFNEYYRDQNLGNGIVYSKGQTVPAEDYSPLTQLRTRAWEKDYFTSALPWVQRGPQTSVPVSGQFDFTPEYSDPARTGNLETGALAVDNGIIEAGGQGVEIHNLRSPQNIDAQGAGININDLREASALQRWLERNARGGARYIEQILAHFGVTSSDSRLQRPEYLGGGKSPVVISEVLQTSETGQETPLAEMAGHGVSIGANHGFNRRFEEHGFVIGIMSILPRTAYQQGIEKHWFRRDRFDYLWPEFAQLGEQQVFLSELYHDYKDAEAPGFSTFGYQSRYAEYKSRQSKVVGDFRDSLNYWHLGRVFQTKPQLNTSFIQANPDTRIFAITDENEDHLYCQVYNGVRASRQLPYYNNPSLR